MSIDENELLTWLDSHKILSKRNAIASDGKFYYAIDFVALNRKIRELSGISESEVITIDEQTEAQAEV